MADQNTQKPEQTDNIKVPVNPEEKPKSQDELTIDELAQISGGAKRTATFGRQ